LWNKEEVVNVMPFSTSSELSGKKWRNGKLSENALLNDAGNSPIILPF
jgi:hypothetical protein